ncbi:MAG: adenosine deaminase [Pontimonas sp.]
MSDYSVPGTKIDIQSLPKVSLHDHLDGGLRPGTILELAETAGAAMPEDPATGAPIDQAERLGQWFADQSDSGSLVEYLKTFDVTLSVMQTEDGLQRIAKEFVEDLIDDGVIYGEIRWAPEQHLQNGLSLDGAVEAVQAGLNEAVAAAVKNGDHIQVGQIISAMRQNNRSMDIANLALRHREKGAVGFDTAGPEAGFPASRFIEAFTLLANEMFPVTIHAGEADGIESIRGALVDGHALRLGHGVRIAEEIAVLGSENADLAGLGPVARWVLERGIPLEVSPSSNLQTGAIAAWGSEIGDHPFDALYKLGFAVTVNTDNRLMSSTTLTKELFMLSNQWSYGMSELLEFQLNAASASFARWDDKEALVDRLVNAYAL